MHVRLCCVQACVHGVGMGLVVEGDGGWWSGIWYLQDI